MGAGKMMLKALLGAANALSLKEVLCYGTTEMQGLYGLLSSEGFELFSDGHEEIYPVADIMGSEKTARYLKKNFKQEISPLADLGEHQRKELKNKLRAYSIAGADERADEELSFAVKPKGGDKALSAILLASTDGKTAAVEFAAAFSKDTTDIVALFAAFLKNVVKKPEIESISFLPVNPQVGKFVGELARPLEGQGVYHGIKKLKV